MANGTIAASQLEMLTQSGTGIITIVPPATNTNRTLTLPDATGTVLTTATAGVPVNGPAFSAYSSAGQTINAGVIAKITINIEEFDTNNCFDSTANYRFTPTVAGYYQTNANIRTNPLSGTTILLAAIYKNGSVYKANTTPTNGVNGTETIVSCIVYLNGTTDYIEFYVQNGSSSSTTTQNSNISTGDSTWFQAAMIRGA